MIYNFSIFIKVEVSKIYIPTFGIKKYINTIIWKTYVIKFVTFIDNITQKFITLYFYQWKS